MTVYIYIYRDLFVSPGIVYIYSNNIVYSQNYFVFRSETIHAFSFDNVHASPYHSVKSKHLYPNIKNIYIYMYIFEYIHIYLFTLQLLIYLCTYVYNYTYTHILMNRLICIFRVYNIYIYLINTATASTNLLSPLHHHHNHHHQEYGNLAVWDFISAYSCCHVIT